MQKRELLSVLLCAAVFLTTKAKGEATVEIRTIEMSAFNQIMKCKHRQGQPLEYTFETCEKAVSASLENLSSPQIERAKAPRNVAHTNFQYSTSFESENYNLGDINEQNGWTVLTPPSEGTAIVVDGVARTGAYSLLITNKNESGELTVVLQRTLPAHLSSGTHYSFDAYWAPRSGSRKSSLAWKIVMTDGYFISAYALLSDT